VKTSSLSVAGLADRWEERRRDHHITYETWLDSYSLSDAMTRLNKCLLYECLRNNQCRDMVRLGIWLCRSLGGCEAHCLGVLPLCVPLLDQALISGAA